MNINPIIRWQRALGEKFVNGEYRRTHSWSFDGGSTIMISSSPGIVPVPFSDPDLADPEEAFVASIASCHMLFFLALASRRKLVVDDYRDEPEAMLEKDHAGRMSLRKLILRPKVTFRDPLTVPEDVIEMLHEQAHASCFLANSVKTEITIQLSAI